MSESEVKYKGICVELKLETDIDNRGKASHKSEEKKKNTHSFVSPFIDSLYYPAPNPNPDHHN